jgi:MFS family permease
MSKNRIILMGIILLDTLSIGVLIPILPALFNSIALPAVLSSPEANTVFWYSLIIGIHPLCAFFSAPYLGVLSDKVGRKPVLVLALFSTAISFAISVLGALSGSLTLLAIGRVVDGITSGNISVARAALLDQTDPEDTTSNVGVIGALFGVGMILGPLIGSIQYSIFNFPPYVIAIIIAGLFSLIATLVTTFFFHETHHPKPGQPIEKLTILPRTEPLLKPFVWAGVFNTVAFAMFTTYWALFVSTVHSFSEKNIATMFVVIGIAMAITQAGIVRFVARFVDPYRILSVFSPLLAVAFLLLGYVVSGVLYLGIILFALMNGLVVANRLGMMQVYGQQFGRGYVSGIDASYTALSAAIAPGVLIISAFFGIRFPFWVIVCLVITMWCITLVYLRPKKEK